MSSRPSRRDAVRLCGSLLLLGAWLLPQTASAAPTARELLDRFDDLYRGDSSHGKMTMKVVTAHWSRELKIEFWSKGKEKSLARILAPTKEKGTATLKVDNDMWNYLPKVNRVIKIPSSMMGDAWMGSHFTNDDLVKEHRMADDFEFEITFQGQREGQEVIEITCTPRAEAAVVWGKVVIELDAKSNLPTRVRYFDEDLAEARVMSFSQVKTVQGRLMPTMMTIVPNEKPNESTAVVYDEIAFDLDVDDKLFSLRSLQR